MRAVFWPFFSQQDKRTGRVLTETCGDYKMCSWMAERLRIAGWDANVVTPDDVHVPSDNVAQRLQFHAPDARKAFADADVAIVHHDHMGFPLRQMFPELKIVQGCHVDPFEPWPQFAPLMKMAWDAADLVTVLSPSMRVDTKTRVSCWPMAFDEQLFAETDELKTIDVLFVNRASATNYTRHVEFLRQIDPDWRVLFTDPTRYMEHAGLVPVSQLLRDKTHGYRYALKASKVFVALNDNGHGGLSAREAIVSGCCPVALRCPGYERLLGEDWPYFVPSLDEIRETVNHALRDGWPANKSAVQAAARAESYQSTWPTVVRDLESL